MARRIGSRRQASGASAATRRCAHSLCRDRCCGPSMRTAVSACPSAPSLAHVRHPPHCERSAQHSPGRRLAAEANCPTHRARGVADGLRPLRDAVEVAHERKLRGMPGGRKRAPIPDSVSVASPVAIHAIMTARALRSAGRFSPLGPRGICLSQYSVPMLDMQSLALFQDG
jgi:hypothetical protein